MPLCGWRWRRQWKKRVDVGHGAVAVQAVGQSGQRFPLRPPSSSSATFPNFEILNEEALQIIEYNAETVLEEIGVNFVENEAALARWRDAGADVRGERVHIPRGLARKLCATAPSRFTQYARNPERNVEIGGNNLVLAPVYGPSLRARCRGRSALCHYGGFREIREAGLYVEVAAPLWRHGVRADRHSGEQASSWICCARIWCCRTSPIWARSPNQAAAVDSVEMSKLLFGADFVDQNTVMTS